MAQGPGFDPDELDRGERQKLQQLQARVFTLEARVASLERIINAILGVPEGDPVLDAPVL